MNIKHKFYLYFILIVLLSTALVVEVAQAYSAKNATDILWVVLISLTYLALYLSIRKDFLLPFSDLQQWVSGFKFNQNTRLDEEHETAFKPVAIAINHLIDENHHLYDDMESILKKQIQRLSNKSASLETLYSVSSKLNQAHTTEELFEYFLSMFVNMTGASSGAARSFTSDGELQLVAQQGVINTQGQELQVLSSDCFCGEVAMAEEAGVQFSVHNCAKCVGNKSREVADVGTIFIPLRHHGKTLGVFNLFFDKEPSLAYDERALLESIAENIAIALDKSALDKQTKRMALSQERLFLSQEIHDSLAQTIYSLKLQVSVLGNSLKQAKQMDAYHQIDALQTNITQANQELRELMCNFRVPLDPNGIEVSLKNLVNRFKAEEGVATYLQVKGKFKVEPEVEMQIMRITQEALSNIRKHAKARNVRILLTAEPHCQLLIEDDGVGFVKEQNTSEVLGNNIGMNIMNERAQRAGASIEIESELDEGTRITVNFKKNKT
jgi:two-component system, NarL family, nitrate/nitrite sensor histidine kinase NarX